MRKLLVLLCVVPCLAALSLSAADVTRLHIHVINDLGKPVGNAEVVVRFLESRILKPKKKQEWEMRTTQEGTVSTPGIPQGKIMIQISARNYQTFGETFDIEEAEKTVEIQLKPPQPQYSSNPAPPAK
jgi:uncharacterized GH25 family protein